VVVLEIGFVGSTLKMTLPNFIGTISVTLQITPLQLTRVPNWILSADSLSLYVTMFSP
jgi:hypothetical protein